MSSPLGSQPLRLWNTFQPETHRQLAALPDFLPDKADPMMAHAFAGFRVQTTDAGWAVSARHSTSLGMKPCAAMFTRSLVLLCSG